MRDLNKVGAGSEASLKGFHHLLCLMLEEGFQVQLVNVLVRAIQNDVLDGREACGESGNGSLAEHNELLVLRVVLFGIQLEVLDLRQAEMAAVNFLDQPSKVARHHVEQLDKTIEFVDPARSNTIFPSLFAASFIATCAT